MQLQNYKKESPMGNKKDRKAPKSLLQKTLGANDANALAELDVSLRHLDPNDPVKYDFALFGLGVFEKF